MNIYIVTEKTEKNNILGVYTNLKDAEIRRNCLAIDKYGYYELTQARNPNESFADFALRHFEIKEYNVQ
jgi:hypothetical protein